MFIATSSAFGLSLDIMCWIFITCIIVYYMLIDTRVSDDQVGLAVTQAMSLTGMLQWGNLKFWTKNILKTCSYIKYVSLKELDKVPRRVINWCQLNEFLNIETWSQRHSRRSRFKSPMSGHREDASSLEMFFTNILPKQSQCYGDCHLLSSRKRKLVS